MSDARVAKRYANSIITLASELNQLDAVSQDMDLLRDSLSSQELVQLIKSPIIKAGTKQTVFHKIFDGKLSDVTMRFIDRVIAKGRESALPDMIRSYNDLLNEIKGVTKVTVTTLPNPDSSLMDSINRSIPSLFGNQRQVQLEYQTDSDLIGGFILEFEDKRYDTSIRHKLEELKNTFSRN